MKRQYKIGYIPSTSDKYLDDVKQALVDKGVATEDTPNSELDDAIKNINTIKMYLDCTKTCRYMFQYCYDITDASKYLKYSDTSNVKNMSYMFEQCTNLTTVPDLDTRNVQTMSYMFKQCPNLTTAPYLDTSNVYEIHYIFYECTNLTTVPNLDLNKCVTSILSPFGDCKNLTILNLYNIRQNIQIGSGTSWGHLLTLDSLINACKECIKYSSNRTLTMGSTNKNKLTNVYVKFTDSSQTKIAEGEKGDVVVCESTDEGAMTITEYMTLKKWTLA
jgi:surface protein